MRGSGVEEKEHVRDTAVDKIDGIFSYTPFEL